MHAMIELGPADVDAAPPRDSAIELGILAYQAAWAAGFRAESEHLANVLAPLAPRFEHVGSTAVPGLAARPIIDVLAGVARPADVAPLLGRLRARGYWMTEGTDGADAGRRLLVRWQRGVPTHHVHVVEYLGTTWRHMLLFRDVLRLDARLAREYEWLRRRFAGLHPANRVAYARAKATFVHSVLAHTH
jgi:GrpB-like predicted nucleotidyltransferase (UPF0157 family)